MIEELLLAKDIAVLAVLAYIVYNLTGFERSWRENRKTAAHLIKLNEKESKIAFTLMFVATLFSSAATFFLASKDYALMTAMFDICLIFWAGFFKIMNDTVNNREHSWPGYPF